MAFGRNKNSNNQNLSFNYKLPNLLSGGTTVEPLVFIENWLDNFYYNILLQCYYLSNLSDNNVYNTSVMFDSYNGSTKNSGILTLLTKGLMGKSLEYYVFEYKYKILEKRREIKLVDINYLSKTKEKAKVVNFNIQNNASELYLLRIYLYQLYQLLLNSRVNINLSTLPILYADGLRSHANPESKLDLEAQLTYFYDGLKEATNGALLDAKDRLETAPLNTDAVSNAVDFIYKQIANVTGLPLATITGAQQSSLSDTGIAQDNSEVKAITKYFYKFFYPIVSYIFDEIDVKIKSKTKLDFLAENASIIGLIEASDILPKKVKQKLILGDILGYEVEDITDSELHQELDKKELVTKGNFYDDEI